MRRLFLTLFLLIPICGFSQGASYARFDTSALVSTAVTLDPGYYATGLLMPQGLTDSLNFQVSLDGTTWYTLHDPVKTVKKVYYVELDSSATRAVSLDPNVFWPWRRLKIVSIDTTSAAWDTVRVISEKKKKGWF